MHEQRDLDRLHGAPVIHGRHPLPLLLPPTVSPCASLYLCDRGLGRLTIARTSSVGRVATARERLRLRARVTWRYDVTAYSSLWPLTLSTKPRCCLWVAQRHRVAAPLSAVRRPCTVNQRKHNSWRCPRHAIDTDVTMKRNTMRVGFSADFSCLKLPEIFVCSLCSLFRMLLNDAVFNRKTCNAHAATIKFLDMHWPRICHRLAKES